VRTGFKVYLALFFLVAAAPVRSRGQAPSGTPEDNPTGNAGALKTQITTAGSYDAHSGNATRAVTDLHVPGALGVYGLDFTRYWNSIHNDYDDPYAERPSDFGDSGWSHSWRWRAQFVTWSQELGGDGSEEVFYTEIIITFPDGHLTKYKVVRSNRPHGIPPNVHPADPRFGPPYTAPELASSWPDGGTGVHDHVCNMAADGSEFWLCLADGGSVHFTQGYQASEVFDPHGLRTALEYYPDGSLKKVTQEGGRYLEITWGDFSPGGYHVIRQVQSGGPAGVQTVSYEYSDPPLQGYFRVLNKVKYENEPTPSPSPNDRVAAQYDYDFCYGEAPCSGQPQSPLPLLKYANDPHYAGPMTVIRYNYSNLSCPPPIMNPLLYPDYFGAQPYSIAAEKAPTGLAVSTFSLDCYSGTRREDNALGGWRQFYFGTSAGTTESAPAPDGPYLCRSYQLGKVTDFTSSAQLPSTIPLEKQNFTRGGQLRHTWDGRNLRIEALSAVGDDSGEPSQINHPDTSSHSYNRTAPGNSAPLDTSRMHNSYNHWLFSHTDEGGFTTTYTRDSRRRVTQIDYHGGTTELFSYNDFDQITSHTLPSGAVQAYLYDDAATHRLLVEYNSVDGWDARKEYIYDDPNHPDLVHKVIDARARSSGAQYSTRMEYDGRNRILEVHYAPTDANLDPKVTYGYDTYGNCTSITDEMGHTSEYEYDSYRRCTAYTEPLNALDGNENNIASRRWDWIYDRWIDYVGYSDASSHTANVWRIQIGPAFNDGYERPMIARSFDLQNRLTYEQTGWIQPSGQPLGNWYPGLSLETHITTYDANGNKNSFTDPRGRVTNYTYDNRNRLWQTIEPLNRVTETLYDWAGNKTMVKFPVEAAGQRTQQWRDYDAFGQARTFIDERNNQTELAYKWGPMKKLESVTTHRMRDDNTSMEDQPTIFSYDLMGKPTDIEFPDHTHEHTSYPCKDGVTYLCDQPRRWTNRKGKTKTISYDARGRQSEEHWDDGQTSVVYRIWDNANRLFQISNWTAGITFWYDDAGQLLAESEYVAGADTTAVTSYRRYSNGLVWQLWYPSGLVTTRAYTTQGWLQEMWENSPGASHWLIARNYHLDGKVEHQDYFNGMRTYYEYDERGNTRGINHYFAPGWQSYSYRYYWRDERDRIVASQKGSGNPVNPMENGRGNHYWYDGEGQLTDAYYGAADPMANPHDPERQEYFPYDALGNRQGATLLATRGWLLFQRRDNGLNQYISLENTYPFGHPLHWGSGIFYDDNSPWAPWTSFPGNGVTMADGWLVASYNALNQPVAMIPLGWSDAIWFGYDPLGRCVKRWVGPSGSLGSNPATYFYYDGWNLIQEGSQSWNAERLYLHGDRADEMIAQITPGNGAMRYFHADANGNYILQTDGAGSIREQYDYDAFGQPYFYDAAGNNIGYSPWGNRFLFTGREWLSDLKLYDYRNRMYQPELGRFMQPDPKEFSAGDYNLYRYCHNDPVNKTDPFGLVPPEDGLIDLPRKTVQEIKEAMKDNIRRTLTEKSPDGPGGKPRSQEHRTMAYDNSKGERKTSTETGHHENGIYPYTEKPKNPFNQPATPAWDSHSHISGSGKPYAPRDFTSADHLGVPSGVQSATGGPLYIYVPSATRGGEGGLFRIEGARLINDATGQEAPH
jgi:RHS repeat-associated protein